MINNRNIGVFAYLLLEEADRRNHMRIERRLIRDEENAFEMPDMIFQNNFRLTKGMVQALIETIRPFANVGVKTSAIKFELKVLASLIFFANGSYQTPVGNSAWNNMSQPSISRAINEVARLIANNMLAMYVKFPTTVEARNEIKQGFFNKWGFRGIIGAIDGTHVNIIAPPLTDMEHQPHLYVNRKGKHSINVMLISDTDCNILAVNARYPGSVHDAAIWQMSDIKGHLQNVYERGDRSSRLIGDSGYRNEPWLFTPYGNVLEGTPEARFNVMLKSARNVIERTNGLLKARFRCLLEHRVLNYHPVTAAYIIYSCSVLHNIALRGGLAIDGGIAQEEIAEEENGGEAAIINDLYNAGQEARNTYVQRNLL